MPTSMKGSAARHQFLHDHVAHTAFVYADKDNVETSELVHVRGVQVAVARHDVRVHVGIDRLEPVNLAGFVLPTRPAKALQAP